MGVISAKTLTSFMQYQNHLRQHFAGVNLCVQRRLGDSHGEVVYTKDYVVHTNDLHGEVVHANKGI